VGRQPRADEMVLRRKSALDRQQEEAKKTELPSNSTYIPPRRVDQRYHPNVDDQCERDEPRIVDEKDTERYRDQV